MTRNYPLLSITLAAVVLGGGEAQAQAIPAAIDSSFNLSSASSKEKPKVPATVAPVPSNGSSVDETIQRAQERFQDGKRLLKEGSLDAARASFDQAIDTLLRSPLTAEDRAKAERRIEELVDLIYRYDVDNLGSGQPQDKIVFDKSPLDEIRGLDFPIDPRMKGMVQNQVVGTVSQLPLEMNNTVLSFVNYFSTTKIGRNTLINGWRRSNRYRPMIQRVLAEEGVPQELIFLAQAESGFLPRARSYKAACGMWQFVSWRGKEYGLEQSSLLDMRLDPERATRAAARHLKDLYMQFGDWYLAMAAYNCGPGCVDRAVQRTGYADYWELHRRRAIPKETTNYVPIIVAMTIVTKNAKDYGIDLDDPDPALEYDTIKVDTPTHIELIAGAADLPISGIRDLNPAILRNTIPAGYEVHVPKGSAEEVTAAVETVPASQRASWRLHRVKPGESLTQIAQLYRTTPKTILSANADMEDTVVEGDMLVVPASLEKKTTTRTLAVQRSSKRTINRVAVKRSTRSQAAKSQTKPSFRTSGKRVSAK